MNLSRSNFYTGSKADSHTGSRRDSKADFRTAADRSRIKAAIRSFFISEGYLEVETPALSPGIIPEAPIEVFETVYFGDIGVSGRKEGTSSPSTDQHYLKSKTLQEHIDAPKIGGRSQALYLLPSPELYMKKLIAEGSGNIFQIGKSFRNGEEAGGMHNPEFSMLEWYTLNADYSDSIRTTEELFSSLIERAPYLSTEKAEGSAEKLSPPFRSMSMREACIRYAGIDLKDTPDRKHLAEAAERKGMSLLDKTESWEQLFNRIFITWVEPELPPDSPTVIYDYPAQIPALAKASSDGPWLERWELYIGGVELANCYSEETDPKKIRKFFEKEYAAKASNAEVIPDIDEEFISIFENSLSPPFSEPSPHRPSHTAFPQCSGTALGVDRLIMLLTGNKDIEGVILFPFSDILDR